METGSISAALTVQQSIASALGNAGVSVLKEALDSQEAMVEKLLSPPAAGTGTVVDKLA